MTRETNRSAAIKELKRLLSDGTTLYYVDRYQEHVANYVYVTVYCISIFNSQPMNINDRILAILDVEFEEGGKDIVIAREDGGAKELVNSLSKVLGITLKVVML